MTTGLLHAHKYLGYLLFAAIVVAFVLTLTGARKKAGLAKVVSLIQKIGVNAVGGVVMLVGVVLFFMLNHSFAAGWVWLSIVLWAPIAILGKRFVTAEAQVVLDGGEGSGRMTVGVLVQIILLTAIIGLMTVKPF